MMTCQSIAGSARNGRRHCDALLTDAIFEFDNIPDAEGRATLVFEMLLTYLADDDLVLTGNSPWKY